MSSLTGLWYKIDPFSGKFLWLGDAVAAASSPGQTCVCVTAVGADPENWVFQALNSAAVVPMPLGSGRWTVVWATLKAAWLGSTTTPLLPTTA
jgi:hypothetical protein